MLSTNSIKASYPVFTIGCTNPKEVILIVGSCRCVPYLNYVARWSKMNGDCFRIHFIEPWNAHWDAHGKEVDFEAALSRLEGDGNVRQALRETTIYIHEFYNCAGMFNSSPDEAKNIHQFGLNPRVEVSIPNFNDVWLLFREQLQFDEIKRERVKGTGGIPTPMLIEEMKTSGLNDLERFYRACRLSSLPEMEQHFEANWRSRRMFWKGNHVSKHFTMRLFYEMNDKFLDWPLTEEFCGEIFKEDLYGNVITPVTQFDRDAYGITWDEPTEPLHIP